MKWILLILVLAFSQLKTETYYTQPFPAERYQIAGWPFAAIVVARHELSIKAHAHVNFEEVSFVDKLYRTEEDPFVELRGVAILPWRFFTNILIVVVIYLALRMIFKLLKTKWMK